MKHQQKDLYAYCEAHTTPPHPVLQELERETHLKTLAPQMMTGPLQGQLLRLLSLLLSPQVVLEIGTFTGYGAICLAQGLAPGGVVHTIEANPERETIIRKYLTKAGLEGQVKLYLGQAETILPTLEMTFDLVLIDGGKQDYGVHYDLVLPKLRVGGIVLVDNVLWDGKVVRPNPDQDTRLIQAFNAKVQADARVENVLLPLRDGLLVARRIQ